MNQMFVNFKRMNVYATDMEPEGSAQRGQQLYGIQTGATRVRQTQLVDDAHHPITAYLTCK